MSASRDPGLEDRSSLAGLVLREAQLRGVPPAVADAVAFVESGYDARAVGSAGEIGLMQVLPSTAAMLGHRGPTDGLLDPAINVRIGVTYLAGAWKLAQGDLCRALMKYRAGHGEERMTGRSVEYCRRARERMAATGSAPAGASLAREVADRSDDRDHFRSPGGTMRPGLATRVRRSWAEHVARVQAIEARIDRVMRGG